ncbi:uncharacterized protein LOC104456073 [Eucalyptus grandis]|uniref:uncharacterized protein LOC104456073 n=1 Tax=Eucalyptus grandis TaxID=71139 RepID=UPI00192ED474|nr:uncharacterized protein LOC104456073 [Eucalyptus grandis]
MCFVQGKNGGFAAYCEGLLRRGCRNCALYKEKMEDLQRTAKVYFDAAAENVKQLAQDFVTEMDHDHDGVVCLSEFLSFTKVKGYVRMSNPYLFKQLNVSGTGKLSFDEAITFFYIATSARPLCDGCGCLALGMFFTCVKCFKDAGEAETFNLCSDCFSHGNYTHPHNDFLDNFVMLEAMRRELRQEKNKFQPPATDANTSTSFAIVPTNPSHAMFTASYAFLSLFLLENVEFMTKHIS